MDNFFSTYFSYIILGLVLTFGYIAYRVFSRPEKKRDEDWQGVEAALREAEMEARRKAALRESEKANEPTPEPSEEKEKMQEEEEPPEEPAESEDQPRQQ